VAPTDRYVAETSFHVRYAETDAMGIVHHASYIVYFEEGRSHFTRALGRDYAEFEQEGFAFAVTEVHARYGAPARYGQKLTVRCWIVDLKTRAVTFGYEIVDALTGTVHVTGETRHMCVTRQGDVTRIPDSWRALLAG
jgi:acyl-CoA thioester hydrolase